MLAAKIATGTGISLADALYAFAVTELVVAGARAVGRHIAVGWNWPQLAGFAVFVLLTSAIGIAFGALLHNTAVAIVACCPRARRSRGQNGRRTVERYLSALPIEKSFHGADGLEADRQSFWVASTGLGQQLHTQPK